jgi:hypothetical protein
MSSATRRRDPSPRIPEATLREEWSATYVAWAGTVRPTAAGHPRVADAARDSRRAEALLRLAADPRAMPHERALAAQKAAQLLVRG